MELVIWRLGGLPSQHNADNNGKDEPHAVTRKNAGNVTKKEKSAAQIPRPSVIKNAAVSK